MSRMDKEWIGFVVAFVVLCICMGALGILIPLALVQR